MTGYILNKKYIKSKEYKVFYNDFIMISSEIALHYVLEKSGQEDLFDHIKDLQKLFGFKLILDNSFLENEIFFMHPTIPCIYCLEF